MTTVYPVAELGINPVEGIVSGDDTTAAPMDETTPTQRFLPTVAIPENYMNAFTSEPETHTFVPYIPSIIPETTPTAADETPLMASAEESTEISAEEPSGIATPDTEPDDGVEAESEQPTDGKVSKS